MRNLKHLDKRLRRGLITFAFCVCLAGAQASWQLQNPLTASAIFPFSETWYARAIAERSPLARVSLAQKATDTAPLRAENWALAAFACQQRRDKLSDCAINNLRHSYAVAPFSPYAREWRIGYAFSNWRLLPRDLRTLAMSELIAYQKTQLGKVYISRLQKTVLDPEGRVALSFTTQAFSSEIRSEP